MSELAEREGRFRMRDAPKKKCHPAGVSSSVLTLTALRRVCRASSARSCSQSPRSLIGWQRAAEIVALNLVTMMLAQKRHLLFAFDSFGNDPEIQVLGQADDRCRDRGVIRIHSEVLNKGTVNFELVDRKLPQVARQSRLTECTIRNFKNGKGTIRPRSLRKLTRAIHDLQNKNMKR